MILARALAAMLLATAVGIAAAAPPASVFIEELTSPELRDAVRAGKTIAIIPVGGTEQSGPALALGKHNVRAAWLAQRIAASLGNALVAPVVAYVPEGSISPPTSHMRYPGTISIPDSAFQALLDGAAKSLKQAGFTHIVLIGDHGGYQSQLKAVAQRLNRDWAGSAAQAHYVETYYRITQTAYVQALRERGLNAAQIGVHAGTSDTSLMLATDPSRVRTDQLDAAAQGAPGNGVNGDPRPSSVALGQLGVDLIVTGTVNAIREATAARQ